MTEQIKSAIEDFQEWIDRAEKFKPNMLSDHVKAMKLTIRSLQSWEEVLQELEEERDRFNRCNLNGEVIGVVSAIEVINKHLADVKE